MNEITLNALNHCIDKYNEIYNQLLMNKNKFLYYTEWLDDTKHKFGYSTVKHKSLKKTSFRFGLGINYCKLCELFNCYDNGSCNNCPVKINTGSKSYESTPYITFANLINNKFKISNGDRIKITQEIIDACEAEVNFLKSLLPIENSQGELK